MEEEPLWRGGKSSSIEGKKAFHRRELICLEKLVTALTAPLHLKRKPVEIVDEDDG